MSFKDEIVGYAKTLGADLVGVASVDRFQGAPAGFRPTDLMPQAQSVVVLAKRLPRGVLESHVATSFHLICHDLYKRLDYMAYDLACFIEDKGGRALPVPASEPYSFWDEAERRGMGDLSHKHAAWVAGLGCLGKNTLLITPEYGNRVQLVSLICDLQLEPDEMISDELCPAECRLCIDACPTGAITADRTVVQKLCRELNPRKLPRGYTVLGCWECRRVCPV